MLRSKLLQVSNAARNFRVVGFSSDTTKDVDTTYMEIPVYDVDKPQSLENRKARLQYQSRKRGMLENDLLLSTFAKKYLDGFTEEQTMMYDRLINSPSNDWDIFYWMVGKQPTPKEFDNEIMNMLKKHAKNEERVTLSQPPLH
ncbi:succinate dehydrogenase assembly factor 2-A, mitochondrial-like [Maniola hyperantus]|uniref:succinate dehydrogenase assembly factor 2-A, mitochondrial-like n=1 Tax=Aphantopus hyperantus TaxID=2795564 RepID=UPI0015694C22|nr:succinate dehydrogenase assembly factor 2-A, mitochondrial-like [Maniola hyperantus]